MVQHMLTTTDNPYDPVTRYDEWDKWDRDHGYNTSSYLARIVEVSDDLSDADYDSARELAIQEITHLNVLGVYRKVVIPESAEDDRVALVDSE